MTVLVRWQGLLAARSGGSPAAGRGDGLVEKGLCRLATAARGVAGCRSCRGRNHLLADLGGARGSAGDDDHRLAPERVVGKSPPHPAKTRRARPSTPAMPCETTIGGTNRRFFTSCPRGALRSSAATACLANVCATSQHGLPLRLPHAWEGERGPETQRGGRKAAPLVSEAPCRPSDPAGYRTASRSARRLRP